MRKYLKRLLCAILIVAVVLPCTAVNLFAYSENSDALIGREILSGMPNAKSLVLAYDSLCDGVADFDESISVNSDDRSVSINEMGMVYEMFTSDHPELSWVFSGYRYTYDGNTDVVYSILPNYVMSEKEARLAEAELSAAADNLCEGLAGRSDYEISLALHDRLAYAVDYALSDNDQNVYGALVEGRAVCAGYAAAYQYLLAKMGISAFTVTGYANDESGWIAHAWNLVLLDGEYYLTDVTWDDQTGSSGHVFHEFFNVDNKKLDETHIPDNIFVKYLPKCTSKTLNYFVKNGTVISEYDTDKIVSVLRRNHYSVAVYAEQGAYELYLQIAENINDIVDGLNLSGRISYGFSMLNNELVINIYSDTLPSDYLTLNVAAQDGGKILYTASLYRGAELEDVVVSDDPAAFFYGLEGADYILEVSAEGYYTDVRDISFYNGMSVKIVLRLLGDLNGDGVVNLKDSYRQKLVILGMSDISDADALKYCDINGDGRVNSKDCYLLKKLMLG